MFRLFLVLLGAGVAGPATCLEEASDTVARPDAEWAKFIGEHHQGRLTRSAERFRAGRWLKVAYLLLDAFFVGASGALSFLLRFSATEPARLHSFLRPAQGSVTDTSSYAALLLLYVILVLSFCGWQDLYRTSVSRSQAAEFVGVVKGVSFATLSLTAFMYLLATTVVSRFVLASSLILNIVCLVSWRYARRRIIVRRLERDIGVRNVVIIGAGETGQELARQLERNKHLGYRFKGFLGDEVSDGQRMLGGVDDLTRVARAEFLDEVFITVPSECELVKRVTMEARHHRLTVRVIPELYDGLGWRAPTGQIGDFPVMDLHWQPIPSVGLLFKRVFDVACSALGLVLCFPLLLVIAVWIRTESSGPAVYRSSRVGEKGRMFRCYKLRTMVANADDLKDTLRHRNQREGAFFKIADDPRITPFGKLLRQYSLDELPQLWNVLKGDMSLVGPRPHPVDDFRQYSSDHMRRLEVRPGLTGLWQVTARQDPSFEKCIQLDLEYIDHWNFLLDLTILLKTPFVVCEGNGQ
jgi:exopolysaccharide biosynthesis polyprenyl glycosylphosphotransferase